MRVLVTGANGYIGKACVTKLAQSGYFVRAITSRQINNSGRVELVKIESLVNADWEKLLTDIDCVIHLAGVAHRKASNEEFISINISATEKICQAAVRTGVKRFIYLSSIAVYGRQHNGVMISENTSLNPQDENGRSKAAAELRIRQIAADSGMSFTIVRLPMVYGCNAPGNFRRLERLVRKGFPLPLAGASAPRSYLGIENLVSALQHVLESPKAEGRTYVLADGDDLSTAQLIGLMANSIGRPSRSWWIPLTLIYIGATLLGRTSEVDRIFGELRVDSKTFCDELGWAPPFSVAESIYKAMQIRDQFNHEIYD